MNFNATHNIDGEKKRPITAVWLDWGFRLNLKLVLYLENFVLNRNINLNLVPNLAKRRDVVA